MHLQVKKTLKVDLFTTPDKSFFGSYHIISPYAETNYLFPAAKGMD